MNCRSQNGATGKRTVPAIKPSPAMWAIARSMKIMPRRTTSAPSGPFTKLISKQANRAGANRLKRLASIIYSEELSSLIDSSNKVNRLVTLALPPIVYGITIAGREVFSLNHVAPFAGSYGLLIIKRSPISLTDV